MNYIAQPCRLPDILLVHGTEPYNAETPLHLLNENCSLLDPRTIFRRNHGPLPNIRENDHILYINGLIEQPLELNMVQLRKFDKHTVVSAIQCAGNRRSEMSETETTQGLQWRAGTISNCSYSGARIGHILKKARCRKTTGLHIVIACDIQKCDEDGNYETSIPIEKAMSEECLLAYEMNGKVLPREHGFPVRAVIPGFAGARMTKFVTRITVQEKESSSYYQQHDYKILPPHITSQQQASAYWSNVLSIQEMPVNSAITSPQSGEAVISKEGRVELTGYAVAGPGGCVKSVYVGDGDHWIEANLQKSSERWAMVFWNTTLLDVTPETVIYCRAVDESGKLDGFSKD
ncbi:Sulfite oxidase [Neolecta irregularis DAH-3]|uniref:Sulfite oxidase n=1 Tax=Neolecta irregularis (strain DAH-3) TaxID=1198029 RepID=A0A1U7LIC2_NEOID|nr:Sulfite oxidase [Neolecta irregularis DAH-3]|eukprot:OLL22410.1 Sulfite oxidase [Neolecta irregularis DAH-3]